MSRAHLTREMERPSRGKKHGRQAAAHVLEVGQVGKDGDNVGMLVEARDEVLEVVLDAESGPGRHEHGPLPQEMEGKAGQDLGSIELLGFMCELLGWCWLVHLVEDDSCNASGIEDTVVVGQVGVVKGSCQGVGEGVERGEEEGGESTQEDSADLERPTQEMLV